MENKAYVAPEAIVVEFEESDLLSLSKLSKGESGNPGEADW